MPYHELRTKAIETFGNEISAAVEKIACSKKKLISKTIEKLKNSEDRKNFFIEMSYDGSLISHQDKEFNQDYWIQFSKFKSESEDEANKFQTILNINFPNFKKLYEKSKENLAIAIDKLTNDETLSRLQIDFIKDAKKAIGKTEELISLLEGLQNVSNKKLGKLSKEFLLLSQNAFS